MGLIALLRCLLRWLRPPRQPPRPALTVWGFRARARFIGESYREVLLRDPCVYCGGQSTGLDHVHPRSQNGADGWENRAPACGLCDGDKSATPLLRYLVERRRRKGRRRDQMPRGRNTRSEAYYSRKHWRRAMMARQDVSVGTLGERVRWRG
jgi:5-methylcytosine-specific restriction endonuclease McrA